MDRCRIDEEVGRQGVQSPPLLPGPTNPHHFQASTLKRMLCIPNCSALSQPQLHHFKSLATELFIYGPRSTDCTAKPFVRRNSAQRARTTFFGCCLIAFFAQGCHLVALNTMVRQNRCKQLTNKTKQKRVQQQILPLRLMLSLFLV